MNLMDYYVNLMDYYLDSWIITWIIQVNYYCLHGLLLELWKNIGIQCHGLMNNSDGLKVADSESGRIIMLIIACFPFQVILVSQIFHVVR